MRTKHPTALILMSLSILNVNSTLCGKYNKNVPHSVQKKEKSYEKSHFYCIFLNFSFQKDCFFNEKLWS